MRPDKVGWWYAADGQRFRVYDDEGQLYCYTLGGRTSVEYVGDDCEPVPSLDELRQLREELGALRKAVQQKRERV